MSIFFATLIYFGSIIAVMQQWLGLAVVLIVAFSVRYGTALFIPAAILLDAYYGGFYSWPVLSLAAVGWFVVVEYLRPKVQNLRT